MSEARYLFKREEKDGWTGVLVGPTERASPDLEILDFTLREANEAAVDLWADLRGFERGWLILPPKDTPTP